MGKLLFLLIAGVVLYLVLVRENKPARRGEGPPAAAERMVACARCGIYVPQGESMSAGGKHYCCEEHRRLDLG
jgi:uncharacterized protein